MIEIDIRHEPKGGLERMAREFPNIGARIAGTMASEFAKHVKAHALKGQALNRRTGRTYKSTKSKRKAKGIYRVRPGVGIRGSLNYLYKFERGGRPFMQPSLRSFRSSGRPAQVMKLVYNRAQADVVKRNASIQEVKT